MNGLTPKQAAFIQEYLIDLNATQAAIRAGYSKKTASRTGAENLSKPVIQSAIQEAIATRSQRTEITADYVLTSLKTVVERSLKAVPVLNSEGNETGQWRFNSAGANKALELLGKHLGLFPNKVEHSGSVETPVLKLVMHNDGNSPDPA